MACKCKKQAVNSKNNEVKLTSYYHGDGTDIERIMDQTMVYVSVNDQPVSSLTTENKKQSENFFKRLFKTMSSSIGSK